MKMSNTIQRKIILEELCSLKSHPSADTLYELVRRRLPRISLGTVYRNLELLSDAGVIMKMAVTGREKRFDGNPCPHPHLFCEVCGAVEDVENVDPRLLDPFLPDSLKRRIRDTRLEFIGECSLCAEAKKGQPDRHAV